MAETADSLLYQGLALGCVTLLVALVLGFRPWRRVSSTANLLLVIGFTLASASFLSLAVLTLLVNVGFPSVAMRAFWPVAVVGLCACVVLLASGVAICVSAKRGKSQ